MPPPPPSASYLLVLDTDSEDEDEQEPVVVQPKPVPTPQQSSGLRRPHVVEDDEDDDVDTSTEDPMEEDSSSSDTNMISSPQPSPTQSKKLTKNQKRRQRKRKKKNSSQGSTLTATANEAAPKTPNVSFSTVTIRSYPRAFSGDSVPADGGWPLGMERDHIEESDAIDVEEFETAKQERLKERWETLLEESESSTPPSPSSKSKSSTQSSAPSIDPKVIKFMNDLHVENAPAVYETRQWDYRSGVKNPLFGVVPESQRQALFLEASGTPEDEQDQNQPQSQQDGNGTTRRSRSNSVTSAASQSSKQSSSSSRRTRSNSVGNFGNNSSNFNDTYNQVYVHHVRNELEELRTQRTKSGATGCNCRKLNIYIPPKDGSAGKKAQHKRLKPSKLAQELKKRNIYDASASREAMEKALQKAIEKEPCCRDEDCFCVRNGIDCQADACSCWHDSHVHAKSGRDILSNDEIKNRCGNPLGTYVVDLDAIDNYRNKILYHQKEFNDDMFCLPAVASSQ